jgi:hypothetical protein
MTVALISMQAFAGVAGSSANAGTAGGGHANATADYQGNGGVGFARTDTDTGAVNHARGVAFGADSDSMDLSWSQATAPQHGPGIASNFNLSIGYDGEVSGSFGMSTANGGRDRQVEAGGTTGHNRVTGGASTSYATGNTTGGGVVRANTGSYNRPSGNRLVANRRVVRAQPTRTTTGRVVQRTARPTVVREGRRVVRTQRVVKAQRVVRHDSRGLTARSSRVASRTHDPRISARRMIVARR